MKRMLLFLAMSLPMAASAQLQKFSGGEGTEASPFLISIPADLNELRIDVSSNITYEGQYFKMTHDIDFAEEDINGKGGNFSTIGDEAHCFEGNFDGQGHSIKNLKVSEAGSDGYSSWVITGVTGLFGAIKGSIIKDVIIDESCKFNGSKSGALVGICKGGKITGCINYAQISGYGSYVGGIVGDVRFGTVISDCKNYGAIKGCYFVGGIVGYASYDYTSDENVGFVVDGVTISDCVNEGHISNDAYGTGGIVGWGGIVSITNCRNSGLIEGGMGQSMGTHIDKTGGIAGFNNGTVKDCINEGVVRGPISAGGIVGSNWDDGIIDHCINEEKGVVEGNGGIAGLNFGTIKNCRNMADVKRDGPSAAISGDNGGVLVENYYTENVKTSNYNNEYYDGAVSRGAIANGSGTLGDVTENNGAVLESVTIDAEKYGDDYWTTFYRRYGNYQADENTKVYTAKAVKDQHGRKVILTEVEDRIIKCGSNSEALGVILRSSQSKIKLTYTTEAATDSYYEGNGLHGADYPMMNRTEYDDYHMLEVGETLEFKKFTNEYLPANKAYFKDLSSSSTYPVKIPGGTNGDVNGDGITDISDVVMLSWIIMTSEGNPDIEVLGSTADVNGDGVIDASDVVAVIKLIMIVE